MEQSLLSRQPFPLAIQNAPVLLPGLAFYYKAFADLSSCRNMGMSGGGPIPYTAISEYAERNHMDDEDFHTLLTFIRTMDVAYLEHVASKKPK